MTLKDLLVRKVMAITAHQGQTFLSVDQLLQIMQFNIKGLSNAKCNYVTMILWTQNIDVLDLQETHLESEGH